MRYSTDSLKSMINEKNIEKSDTFKKAMQPKTERKRKKDIDTT